MPFAGLEKQRSARMKDSPERISDLVARHWRLLVLLFWLASVAYMIVNRWQAIRGFALGDTDDNMRMMQVRALLAGQGWYDLRQYRMNPPYGADIHWSRLVDLPIAGLKLAFAPLFGGRIAEQIAVAVAPALPMLVAMLSMAAAARRLIAPYAAPIAVALIVCAPTALGMWSPLRIDHHGWQLALLTLGLAGLVDPRPGRGGAIVGAASAASLAIGLEMLPYLAVFGAAVALRWTWDRAEAPRLAAYGASLAGGCALGYLLFTSYSNMRPMCDALSPVWLSTMLVAGALAVLLGSLRAQSRLARLAFAVLAGLVIAGAFALTWPDCLGRPEQSSPELERLWLSRVREALPFYRHGARTAAAMATLPVFGLIGYALMLWTHRRDGRRFALWASAAAPALAAAALLLWQTRAAPAAQLLAIPGAAGLALPLIGWLRKRDSMLVRVFGVVTVFLVVSGLATGYVARLFPEEQNAYRRQVNRANGRCPTLAALRPVAQQQPPGLVLTFVDLGPRLITVTPHDAIAGPYHRNGPQILDVMHAWRGSAETAHAIVARYRVDYVLICPNMSESTIYRAEAPRGFYARLARGETPDWLSEIAMPRGSPYRMWRVVR